MAGQNSRNWDVDFYSEFAREFREFPAPIQDAIFALLIKLRQFGPQLGRPDVDTLKSSQFRNMKELRIKVPDGVRRIAFAFDPKRRAILLVGGNKSGLSQKRFYENLIRKADERFARHLATIAKEGKKE